MSGSCLVLSVAAGLTIVRHQVYLEYYQMMMVTASVATCQLRTHLVVQSHQKCAHQEHSMYQLFYVVTIINCRL